MSPDGSQVLFCYKGDIYKVSSKGGTAVQLTTQVSYECAPVWSADGQQIAFASDRYGNLDVFVMAADGGPATRLTYQSVAEEAVGCLWCLHPGPCRERDVPHQQPAGVV